MFIGREKQLVLLEEQYKQNTSFVVMYGRRRTGKTTLIKEFIKNKKALYYLATKDSEKKCIARMARSLAIFAEKPHLENVSYQNWDSLFDVFLEQFPNEKKILIIDEFPYLVRGNEAFPSIMQFNWDEKFKNKNIMLILCGSSISMMKKFALAYSSPLYGRRTSSMKIGPLPFLTVYSETKDSFTCAVEKFSITGGIPQYINLLNNDKSLKENLSKHVFDKDGFLYNEPEILLQEDVKEPVSYFSILQTIAFGEHRFGKIATKLNKNTTELTAPSKTLIDLGFLNKQVPITEKNVEKSRKSLYFLSDNFIRFWFQYVQLYKSELEIGNHKIVFENFDKNFIPKIVAFVFEDICKEIFLKLALEDEKISFSPSKIGSYWSNERKEKNTQIDVVATDNSNKKLFLGECKYHVKPVDADTFFDLKKKIDKCNEIRSVFSGYQHLYGVFSKSGFTKRMLDVYKETPNLYLINETYMVTKKS